MTIDGVNLTCRTPGQLHYICAKQEMVLFTVYTHQNATYAWLALLALRVIMRHAFKLTIPKLPKSLLSLLTTKLQRIL